MHANIVYSIPSKTMYVIVVCVLASSLHGLDAYMKSRLIHHHDRVSHEPLYDVYGITSCDVTLEINEATCCIKHATCHERSRARALCLTSHVHVLLSLLCFPFPGDYLAESAAATA